LTAEISLIDLPILKEILIKMEQTRADGLIIDEILLLKIKPLLNVTRFINE
jgi:hypothetical protein